jgi:hypothetical protein
VGRWLLGHRAGIDRGGVDRGGVGRGGRGLLGVLLALTGLARLLTGRGLLPALVTGLARRVALNVTVVALLAVVGLVSWWVGTVIGSSWPGAGWGATATGSGAATWTGRGLAFGFGLAACTGAAGASTALVTQTVTASGANGARWAGVG